MTKHDQTRRRVLRGLASATVLATVPAGATLGQTVKSNFKDGDNNGYPDEGEVVTGTYKSRYAYDANGDYYWDLGDGRTQGTVGGFDELDQSTITNCYYKVQYRGKFENDPFLDSGWVKNQINCRGYDDNGNYNYIIVHETDPRYTGDGPETFGGDWEYHVDVEDKFGNKLARPQDPPNR